MDINGNTILITGGGTGIGRALAEAFLSRGNTVIIAGRSRKSLDAATEANPGLHARTLDITSPAAIRAFAAALVTDFPTLNVVVNNAGVMIPEDLLTQSPDATDAEAMITTNLLGPIRLTAALLPHLQAQAHATLINVSSGLAFVPLAATPTYCATKAALHSYSESLRAQLKDTRITVLELAPPYVQTTLMGDHQAVDPRAMPLAAFTAEVMDILTNQPDATEILVDNVLPLRHAAAGGKAGYDAVFNGLNASFSAH